jgi:hypothetical protein
VRLDGKLLFFLVARHVQGGEVYETSEETLRNAESFLYRADSVTYVVMHEAGRNWQPVSLP